MELRHSAVMSTFLRTAFLPCNLGALAAGRVEGVVDTGNLLEALEDRDNRGGVTTCR